MFARNADVYNTNREMLDVELERYSPDQFAQQVSNKEGEIVQRSSEQYDAAQAAAPDKQHTGIVTPGYDTMRADFEVGRAEEALGRAQNYASLVAPSMVNYDARLRVLRVISLGLL